MGSEEITLKGNNHPLHDQNAYLYPRHEFWIQTYALIDHVMGGCYPLRVIPLPMKISCNTQDAKRKDR